MGVNAIGGAMSRVVGCVNGYDCFDVLQGRVCVRAVLQGVHMCEKMYS